MAQTTASHSLVDMPPKDAPPAASSHEAVKPPPKIGFCSKVYLVILVLVALPFIPVALLIWCLYKLLAKLIGCKGDSSPRTVAKKESSHNAVESSHENKPGVTEDNPNKSGPCPSILFSAFVLLFLVALIIWCPFWLLSKLLSIKGVSSPIKVAKNLKPNPSDNENDFKKQLGKIDGLVNEGVAAARWRLRILLLLLLSLVIVVSIPGLKRIWFLGLPLRIWMAMPGLLIVSYHYISLLGQYIANEWKETAVVYYLDGLRRSGYGFIVCVFILLAWELYFLSPRHGLRRYGVSKKVLHIGTSLAISLLVGAILAAVKNGLILLWESHTIYHRCTGKIRKVGLQLFFLCLIHGLRLDIFSPDEGILEKAANIKNSDNDKKKLSTYVKKQMAKYFIGVAKLSSREDDTIGTIPDKIRDEWKLIREEDNEYISRDSVKKILEKGSVRSVDKETNRLFEELKYAEKLKDKEPKKRDKSKDKEPENIEKSEYKGLKNPNKSKDNELKDEELKITDKPKDEECNGQNLPSADKILYSTFEEWMTNAFINCVSFGYTLMDAQRAKNKLDIIMTVFLVIVVVLCFLFLAGIASTKVLVTIGTSFATAAFIFGDMLKAFFEGIIFVFVMDPFDVGDWCIIDDTQLEVKSIDILKTTFSSIHRKEEVLYPNKVLAGKTISNFKWHLNNEDFVELSLSLPVGIIALEDYINRFFDENDLKFKDHSVMTKEIGEFIKIAIHFKHVIQDDTHVRYSEKKNKRRSKLLKKILQHIETKETSSTKNIETKGSSSTKNIETNRSSSTK